MKNASRIARLCRLAEALLPMDPDANIIVIRVLRISVSPDSTPISDDGQEVDRARASLQVPWPEDPYVGDFTRDADESEREFLGRVRASVRPFATRQRVNVVASSGY
ncbi:MAG: hypothetical protein ACR2HE_04765 [Casimicrobiaceae bacterium]